MRSSLKTVHRPALYTGRAFAVYPFWLEAAEECVTQGYITLNTHLQESRRTRLHTRDAALRAIESARSQRLEKRGEAGRSKPMLRGCRLVEAFDVLL